MVLLLTSVINKFKSPTCSTHAKYAHYTSCYATTSQDCIPISEIPKIITTCDTCRYLWFLGGHISSHASLTFTQGNTYVEAALWWCGECWSSQARQ